MLGHEVLEAKPKNKLPLKMVRKITWLTSLRHSEVNLHLWQQSFPIEKWAKNGWLENFSVSSAIQGSSSVNGPKNSSLNTHLFYSVSNAAPRTLSSRASSFHLTCSSENTWSRGLCCFCLFLVHSFPFRNANTFETWATPSVVPAHCTRVLLCFGHFLAILLIP